MTRHIISVEVENRFGILARVASLFSARGFNIDSLTVGETKDQSISRMTLVVPGDDQVIEQVIKQLHKLIDVIKVVDLTGKDIIERELILVRVKARKEDRAEVMRIVDIFRAKVVDVHSESFIIEATGAEEKIKGLLTLLRSFGIQEMVRTGKVAVQRKS